MLDWQQKKRKNNMENKIQYINGHKINILDSASDLNDELPNEIDFSNLERVESPLKNITLTFKIESDIAKHFKNSKQLNQFLRLQIKSLEKIR